MIKLRMNPWLMIAINFVIAMVLFSFFRSVGWFEVSNAMPLWAIVLIVGVINVVVSFLELALLVFAAPLVIILATCTLGLGLILLGPVLSYGALYAASAITGLFTMTTIWWQALIIGAAFGWLCITPPSSD